MPRQHPAKYKPLLFTTTIRNPERYKDFLSVLFQYKNQVLTNEIIYKIVKNLINRNLYSTMFIASNCSLKEKQQSEVGFTDNELNFIIENSPQDHKEAEV